MKQESVLSKILVAIAGVLLAAGVATAQTPGLGRIAGRVTDRAGLVLPGVTLTLDARPLSRRAVSDEAGRYAFDNLPVDVTYTLHAELAGFESQTLSGLAVSAGNTTAADPRLGIVCGETIADYISLSWQDALLTEDTVIYIRIDANSVSRRVDDDKDPCRKIDEAPATVLGVVRTRAGQLHAGSPIRIQSEDNAFRAGTEFLVMLGRPADHGTTFASFKNYVREVEAGQIDGTPIAIELERMREEYRRNTRFRTYDTLESTMRLKKLRHQTGWVNLGRLGFADDPGLMVAGSISFAERERRTRSRMLEIASG